MESIDNLLQLTKGHLLNQTSSFPSSFSFTINANTCKVSFSSPTIGQSPESFQPVNHVLAVVQITVSLCFASFPVLLLVSLLLIYWPDDLS